MQLYQYIAAPLQEGEEMISPIADPATIIVDLPEEAAYPELCQLVQQGLLTEDEMLLHLTGKSISGELS